MQAQRSTSHPIPEASDLENMSEQHNVDTESHIYQSERPNLMVTPSLPDYQAVGERQNLMDAPSLPDYQASGSSPSSGFRNIGSQTSGSSSLVNGWATGSVTKSDISADQGCTSEDKMVIGWNPVSNVQSTSRFESQVVDSHVLHSESVSVDAINNQVMDDLHHLHSDCNNYDFSTNQRAVANEGQPFMDLSCYPHPTQLARSKSKQEDFASSSKAGCMPENSNGRANLPMDGTRGPCKRKTVESISGPSSLDGTRGHCKRKTVENISQSDDGHLRFTAPARHTIGSNLNIPVITATIPGVRPIEEPVILWASVGDAGPDFRDLSVVGQSEAPQKAVRARHNPPHQQELSSPQIWPSANVGRYISDLQPNSSHSRRLFSCKQSADTGPSGVGTSGQLRQPSMFHVPSGIQRSLHSVGCNGSCSIHRIGNASSSNSGARERSSSQQEEASSRNMMMGIASNSRFVAGSENRATNHESRNWVPMNRKPNGPGDFASARERSTSQQEKASSRNMRMGIASNTRFVAGSENKATNHESGNWVPMNRNPNGPGDFASARERSSSSSRNLMMRIASNTRFVEGSENRATNHESRNRVPVNRNPNGPEDMASSMLHPLPCMAGGSHHIPFTRATRRSRGSSQVQGLPSSVYRTLQGSHFDPSSSSDVPVPPITGLQVPEYLRSATVLMERQGDGLVGASFGSLQAIDAEGDNLTLENILIYTVADAHDQHREMRLDVDNMTYEELLNLEERIGNVSTGLSEETVSKCLKRSAYYSGMESSADEASKKQPEDVFCSICLEEYKDHEELGILDCGHIHHSECIRKWLLQKNLCPICRKTALNV